VIPNGVTSIGTEAFRNCTRLSQVFYGGANVSNWNSITIGSMNASLTNATRYYYSPNNDEGTVNTHWRWHNGVPDIWD